MKRTYNFSLVLTLLCIPAGLAILVFGEFPIVWRIFGISAILALMGVVAPKTLYLPAAATIWSGAILLGMIPSQAPGNPMNWLLAAIWFVTIILVPYRRMERRRFSRGQMYRNLVEHMNEGLVQVDNQDVVQFVNDRFCAITGYSTEELLGRVAHEVMEVLNDPGVIEKKISDRKQGVSDRYELQLRRKTGERVWVAISAMPAFDTEGRIIGSVGIHTDITARKKTESALRQRVDMESMIATLSTRFINLTTEQVDGAINTALEQIGTFTGVDRSYVFLCSDDGVTVSNTHEWCAAGISPQKANLQDVPVSAIPWFMEQLAGSQPLYIARLSDLPPEAAPVKEILEAQDIRSLLAMPLNVSGRLAGFIGFDSVKQTKTWAEPDIALLQMAGEIFINAIVRRKTFEALSESESQFRQLFEEGPLGMATIAQDFRFLTVNKTLCAMVGYPENELIGKTFLDITHPDDIVREQLHAERMAAGRLQAFQVEKRFITKTNSIVWVDVTVSLMHDTTGVPRYAFAIIENITERKSLQDQLQMRQRLDSLGTLSSGIAHDFNNLLAGIMGNLGLIRLNDSLPEHVAAKLQNAEQTCRRAGDLVRQIQKFSDGGDLPCNVIDVYDAANEAFSFLGATTDRRITKNVDIPPGTYYITANSSEVHQVLVNLGTNAVQAIEERGIGVDSNIRLHAEPYTARQDTQTGLPDGQYVHLRFMDNGAGIPENILKQIFDPFFTTKTNYAKKGQGLGLAMVYANMKRYGLITVESVEQQGTTFHLYFPTAKAPPEISETPPKGVHMSGKTILVVDDEESVRNVIQEALEMEKIKVLTAADGQEGWEVFEAQREEIALVLLDLNMPRMSGADLFRKMREVDPDIHVIVITGLQDTDVDDDVREGANNVLFKPFDIDDLALTVQMTLENPDPPVQI